MNIFFLSLIAYVAGLLTFLAPCTLPMIPVYLSICMKNNFRSLTLHTTYLAIGIAITYVVFGLFAGTLGNFIAIHKLLFMRLTGALLFLVGIATLFNISFNYFLPAQKKFTPIATMSYGVLFGLAWSGCIGPVLGGILVLAGSTGTAFKGGILLLVYAAGMLTPLFVLSIIADRNKQVPKLWAFLKGKMYTITLGSKEIDFHTTNIITGTLFILLGVFFFVNGTNWLTTMFPGAINTIFSIEDKLQTWVIQR